MSLNKRLAPGECPYGGVYYTCNSLLSGFKGCCLRDPCQTTGGGCPEDEDRTPDRYTTPESTTTLSAIVRPQDSSAYFVKLPVSTQANPPVVSSTLLATFSPTSVPLVSSAIPLASFSFGNTGASTSSLANSQPEDTATGAHAQKNLPTAIIVSAIIGGVVFISLGTFLFACMRRRKQNNIYQAPIYVSPFNTSSDSSASSRTSLEVKHGMETESVQEPDGRNVGVETNRRNCAELHGESLTTA